MPLLQGPGDNDGSTLEKVVNVVTSLPFVAVGLWALKPRCPHSPQAVDPLSAEQSSCASFVPFLDPSNARHASLEE
jgi:hypothetical protein